MFGRILLAMIISFAICFHLTKRMIKKKKNVQVEREYLATHLAKNGTTSSGGKAFFISTNIAFLISIIGLNINYKIIGLLFVTGVFFLIGLIDDESKKKNHSSKGLSARLRIILELTVQHKLI